ncbi:ATP-dependent RNA helicase A-like [Lineus longissimus]|uniref:ATP-dependent RNA helicase A-like n=1 Tax=Lineus longissimus TaxID=88925 RepID=UPI002B4D1E7B
MTFLWLTTCTLLLGSVFSEDAPKLGAIIDNGGVLPPLEGGGNGGVLPPIEGGGNGGVLPPVEGGGNGGVLPPIEGGGNGVVLPPIEGGGNGVVLPPVEGGDGGGGGGAGDGQLGGGGDGDQPVKLCTFDDNTWCSMERDGSEHRWSLDASGSSPSPSGDHTSGSGVYARFFVAVAEIADFDRYSLLTVYRTEEKSDYCLSFWYQMDGESQGRITVTGGPKREQIANGHQGKDWKEGKFTMNAVAAGQPVKIIAQYPGGTFGAINLDDIKITKGAC